MTAPPGPRPPFLSRSRLAAATVFALAAVFAGPGVGSALATNEFTISNDVTICEGDSGTTNAVFNIHRANASGSATVGYATAAQTATANADYTITAATASFPTVTDTDFPVSVPIIGDTLDDPAGPNGIEFFNFNLDAPTGTGATAEPSGTHRGTIVDDDPKGTVSIDDASANEGNFATFQLHITAAQTSPCVATVLFSTGGGNDATTYSNFPVTFPSGATTVSSPGVSHFCDNFSEGTENYSASVSASTNTTGSDGATGTIFDGCFSSSSGNADLYIQKVESADPVAVGTEFDYGIGVYNFGPAVAQNVTVSDPLPGGVQFVSAVASPGTCSGTTVVTCNLLNISPGATHYVAIRVRPTGEAVHQNTATVTSSNFDPSTGNNSATTLTQSFTGAAPSAIPNPGGGAIAALRGSRVCSWSGGRCVVIVDCINLEQDCTAVGRGRVVISGQPVASASYRFRRVRRSVAAGEEEDLAFRVGFDASRAIRRALRRGRRVRAKVKVTVTDSAGNRTVRRRTLRLTR